MGCASLWTPEPKIVTVTNTVKTTVPIVARPKAVQLNEIKIYVVNKDNYEEFAKEFKDKNGSLVYIAISIKDYENLSLNFSELRRYIEQQKEIIVYYEEAVKPTEDKKNTP
jgi:hypothetical protein